MANTEQEEREAVFREVGETITAIDAAVRRCRRALAALDDAEPNLRLALGRAAEDLEHARRELQQGTYFGSSQQKLV